MRSPGWRLGLDLERLYYLSTAFSCGYRSDRVPERLHPVPESDPTDYTWSKREAESILARSGVPFVIIRPSVVVGDSRDGRYSGKRYGVYQLWHAAERLMGVRVPSSHLCGRAAEEPPAPPPPGCLPGGIPRLLPPRARRPLRPPGLPRGDPADPARPVTISGSDAARRSASSATTTPWKRSPWTSWTGSSSSGSSSPASISRSRPTPGASRPGTMDDLASRGPADRPCDAADPGRLPGTFHLRLAATPGIGSATPGPMANGRRSRDSGRIGRGRPSGDGAMEVLADERVGGP